MPIFHMLRSHAVCEAQWLQDCSNVGVGDKDAAKEFVALQKPGAGSRRSLPLRPTEDRRITAGGEDESFYDAGKRDAMMPRKVIAIARKAKKLVPAADFGPQFAWAGSFGESPTGLPAIGPVLHLPRSYAVLGLE
jgi:hypothetical protein